MNPYVIPGLEEKAIYIESIINISNVLPKETSAELNRIYNNACSYFNVPPDTDYKSRKTDACNARHWTMFVAKCKGFSNAQIADFFSKNHSMPQHVTNKIMDELEVYQKAQQHFEYFINHEGLMGYHKRIARSALKYFLSKYYRRYQKQIGMIAIQSPSKPNNKKYAPLDKALSLLQEERANLYQHIIDKRELSQVDDAIETLEKLSRKKNTDHFIL